MRKINYKSKYPYSISLHAKAAKHNGGTIINTITAIIFFGLIAFGVMWVMKQTGEQVEQYSDAMVNTQNKATILNCQMNLRAIYQNLQIYALESDEFPDSLEDISGNSRLLRCPDPDGGEYVYIPGQRLNSPRQNIIVYESEPVHNGTCNVLRVNGAIDSITFEELQAAVQQTQAQLR